MKELRCPYCNKLLLKIHGAGYVIATKCPRCREAVVLHDASDISEATQAILAELKS